MPYLVIPTTNNDPDSLVGAKFFPDAVLGSVLTGLINDVSYRVYSVEVGPVVTPSAN